jgi:hypothetical protein
VPDRSHRPPFRTSSCAGRTRRRATGTMRKSRLPSHAHAGCARASGSASCSPCRNGRATAAPSASRLPPTDTASRRSLETCAGACNPHPRGAELELPQQAAQDSHLNIHGAVPHGFRLAPRHAGRDGVRSQVPKHRSPQTTRDLPQCVTLQPDCGREISVSRRVR